MLFEIMHRWNGSVLFSLECGALKLCVEAAVAARADLSAADLSDADLSDADLSYANLRAADLRDADLRDADLSDADLSAANLRDANLRDADLSAADLSYANLSAADLSYANLRAANLRDADLSDANLRAAKIWDRVPVVPDIDRAILQAVESGGKLEMGAWHGQDTDGCGTTHCRAGWAIALAGQIGRNLEEEIGPAAAGSLIYAKSRPGKRVPNFYATNADAMADIKKCAAESGEVAPLGVSESPFAGSAPRSAT